MELMDILHDSNMNCNEEKDRDLLDNINELFV